MLPHTLQYNAVRCRVGIHALMHVSSLPPSASGCPSVFERENTVLFHTRYPCTSIPNMPGHKLEFNLRELIQYKLTRKRVYFDHAHLPRQTATYYRSLLTTTKLARGNRKRVPFPRPATCNIFQNTPFPDLTYRNVTTDASIFTNVCISIF